jgi:hypothetical protein
MCFHIPQDAVQHGFRLKQGGAHGSKTMMLREARLLFASSRPKAPFAELKRLVLEENVVLKDTLSNREEVFSRLVGLYGLRAELRLYRALRSLWDVAEREQPLLALLCALARDPLLRATAPVIFEQPEGGTVTPSMLQSAIEIAFPEHYSVKMSAGISRNAMSTWMQAGHLAGHRHKIRSLAAAGPASAAYALLLGYLCGSRGTLLLETAWARVLDLPPGGIDSLAVGASQRSWIDYRRLGNVADIGFSFFM